MANIGMILRPGYVAVYGVGREASTPQTATPSGVVLAPDFRVGTIYNIWDGGAGYVYGGDIVFWNEKLHPPARIVTQQNLTYSIIPARLVTLDTTELPPP